MTEPTITFWWLEDSHSGKSYLRHEHVVIATNSVMS